MITILSVIFCPNDKYFDRFKDSIVSILSSDLTDVNKIIIDGWVSSDILWEKVQELIKKFDPLESKNNIKYSIILKRRERNIGKSTIINDNVPDTPIIVYTDSDIVIFPDTIQRLKKLNFDIVIPDQLEDCRHYKLLFDKEGEYEGEKIYKLLKPEGVAGGFLMMKTDVIKKFKFPNKGSYGSDDVEFFQRVIKEHSIVMCSSISIVHPFDDNKEYYEWKVNMSLSAYRKELTDNDINKRINNSVNFWNK